MLTIEKKLQTFIEQCENELNQKFKEIDNIELINQLKVLNAFNENNVQSNHFIGSTGYGHNDIGKEKLCQVFASIFHTETAFVTPLISCGTEAISQTLLGLLRPNDTMLCISGSPYDTLHKVIFGEKGKDIGSLKDYNINYEEVALLNGEFDTNSIVNAIETLKPKIIYIQRSRGYSFRNAITIKQIAEIIISIKLHTNAPIIVDNCYGEFTEIDEPTDVGADIVVGSLLKNIGGGIASTGGYIAGKKELIEKIVYKIMSPALSSDNGSFSLGYKEFFEGVFISPHIVAQAKKVAILTSVALTKLGYKTIPSINDTISDIVCSIQFNDKEKLLKFTNAIQQASAVDSNSIIEAGEMDGYEDKIVMASGSFNQGSSIELSCDGPMREPFVAYLQGSLSYAHGKLGLMNAIKSIINKDI